MDEEEMPSYRDQFASSREARSYDEREYDDKGWGALLWTFEREVLSGLLTRSDFVPRREHYLDFACGTGRVMEFVESRFEISTGVDISSAMLERAGKRVPGASLVQADVSFGEYQAEPKVDLMTAFRFLLNADQADRLPALHWMRQQMRDSGSRLVVNNHANQASHKVILYLLRRLKRRGATSTGNVLAHSEVVKLAHQAGFRVESVRGVGYLGGTLLRLVGSDRMEAIQRVLDRVRIMERLAEDQIYTLAPF